MPWNKPGINKEEERKSTRRPKFGNSAAPLLVAIAFLGPSHQLLLVTLFESHRAL